MTELRYEITIDTAPEVVFRHLTERDGLLRWMAVEATVDPVPGGDLTWTHENGATMVGRFVELEPPDRVVFRYGWEGDRMGLPPAASAVEVTLTAQGGSTHLVLVHRDLPAESADDYRHGSKHLLVQLADLLPLVQPARE